MIELKGVTKNFGKTKALDDISTVIKNGRITALLGHNGAGKSTLLKTIVGLNKPDKGTVVIDGKSPGQETKEKIALLPEVDHLYPWMTIKEAGEFMEGFYGDWDPNKFQELLKFMGLTQGMTLRKISKGMRAKAKLALCFSRGAKILLLDEPLSGIDILTREKIIETLINDYTREDQITVISTHEIDEIENIVDEAIVMKDGRIVLQENVDAIRQEKERSLVQLLKEVYADEHIKS